MKRLTTILLCLVLLAGYAFAQSGMTDNQVMDYVIEQNAKGVSRQQIVTQLMQRGVTIDQIRRLQKNRLDLDKLFYYDLPCLFVNGNPTPNIPQEKYFETGSKMFAKMFDKKPSFFQVLGEHDFMDLFSRQNKATGGYCASLLDYGIPYILMNANHTADDVATMVHESGHAYAALRSIDSSQFIECLSPTLEACEIHSTAMEYMTYPFMEMFFGNNADAYRQQHMTLAILFLPYGCLVDEYQHVVYGNPDMTPEERHAAWRELEKKYQPDIDYDGDDQRTKDFFATIQNKLLCADDARC